MSFLSFESLSKNYGAIEALRGIDLQVERGSVVALLGPNGAGKSTLFGCLLGTVLPDSGTVRFDGRQVTDAERRKFGYLAERVALYPQRTVRENAAYLAKLKGIPPDAVTHSLKRVGMDQLLSRKISQLSKGQLQRVGFAIALAGAPDLFVLDEPFNGLDPVVLETVFDVIREERDRGATILVSTHTISAAEEIATNAAILLDGTLLLTGPLDDLRREFPGGSLETIYHQIARRRLKPGMEAMAA